MQLRFFAPIVLFCSGFFLNFFPGMRGFMPLDQSIIFDGGWRILQGQIPFRDFVAPCGVPVMALQALIFAVSGVSWSGYVLHASIVNGLFAVLLFYYLLNFSLPKVSAFILSLCAICIFYPPFGTAYYEQHAIFFAMLCLFLLQAGQKVEGRTQRSLLFLAAVSYGIAYLCKQVPTAYLAPLMLTCVVSPSAPAGYWLRFLKMSCLAFLAFVLCGSYLGFDWEKFYFYTQTLPSEVGHMRSGRLFDAASFNPAFLHSLKSIHGYPFMAWGLCAIFLLYLPKFFSCTLRMSYRGYLIVLLLVLFPGLLLLIFALNPESLEVLQVSHSALWLLLLPLLCGCFLKKPSLSGDKLVPFAVFSASLVTFLLMTLLSWQEATNYLVLLLLSFAMAEKITRSTKSSRLTSSVFILSQIAAFIICISIYQNVALTRQVHYASKSYHHSATDAGTINPLLAGLVWDMPAYTRKQFSAIEYLNEIQRLAIFLNKKKSDFLFIGDTTIISALAGKVPVSPIVWYHPGLTFSANNNPERHNTEKWMLSLIEKSNVRYVVTENTYSWLHVSLDSLPELRSKVLSCKSLEKQFGPFRVIKLHSRCVSVN